MKEAFARLRKAGLIEGLKHNLHVSTNVAKAPESKAEYILSRSPDGEHYAKLEFDYIERFKPVSRKEIDDLLWNLLSESLEGLIKSTI